MSFLSIDVGSSYCKAAVFSGSGELLAMRSGALTPSFPRPGFAELQPEIFFDVVTRLSREVTSLPMPEPIQAVCFSGHGETIVPVSAQGSPLSAAILNMDVRATQEAAWLENEIGRRRLYMLTGHVSHTMYPVPKLLWLRRNAPELFAAAVRFLGVTDYLLVRLGLPPYIDYSHASRFMAFNVHGCNWSREILDLVRIPPEALPVPVPAGTIAGKLDSAAAASLGVSAGTPVVVGGHDQVIGAVGLGVIDEGQAAGSLGTYECILAASDHLQLNDAALHASLNSYPHAIPGKFVTIAFYPAGVMMQWFLHLLYGDRNEHEGDVFRDLEAAAPAGPTGLLITPHLIGSCNPEFDSEARAAISGLTLGATRAHLYKGILEGIASELALIAACLENAGSIFRRIHVSGGGVRSRLGLQLRAAFSGKPLSIMSGQESVCLGGAILAGVAVGVYSNVDVAVRTMVREQESIQPDPLLEKQYASQCAQYRQLRSQLVHRRAEEIQLTGEQT